MNDLISTMKVFRRAGATALVSWCLCATSFGQGAFITVPSAPIPGTVPNALPFTDTFDQYPLPFWFDPPTNGWVKLLGDASKTELATDMWVTPGDAYLFSEKCLRLETEGQTFYNVTTGRAQNVWIDMSVLMVPCEDTPLVAPGTQLGLFLDFDNRLIVYCGLTNGFLTSNIQFAPAPPAKAFRLTLQLAYADKLAVPCFRVYIDQAAVNWSVGYRLPGVSSENGGEWLPCATTNRAFYGLGFMGIGYVDTLKISDAHLGPETPPQADIAQAVAVSWLSDYGRSYRVETCDDLASNVWQSFGAPILGDGTTNTVFDAVGTAPRKFYRVTPL